jgi:predicted dehydrogenase
MSTTPAGERLRTAVVGVAGIGRTHLQAYQALSQSPSPFCTLTAVCDVNAEALEKAEAEFDAARSYTEYRALLDDPNIDVISLCVPHFLHRRMALAAIAAGKHLCIHGWDLLQWLLGGVEYAYGYWTNLLHPTIEVEDIGYGCLQLRGPKGEVVPAKTVATTCQEAPAVTDVTLWKRRLSIHIVGEHGEVIANDFRAPRMGLPMAEFRLRDDRLERELGAGMEDAFRTGTERGQVPSHEANIRAFLDAILSGRPTPVTPESAAEVQKIIDGIHWHGWNHAGAFREWAAAQGPLPADADAAKASGWDGGVMWQTLLRIVEDEAPGLEAPFLR